MPKRQLYDEGGSEKFANVFKKRRKVATSSRKDRNGVSQTIPDKPATKPTPFSHFGPVAVRRA